jgi:hypothetical protein
MSNESRSSKNNGKNMQWEEEDRELLLNDLRIFLLRTGTGGRLL